MNTVDLDSTIKLRRHQSIKDRLQKRNWTFDESTTGKNNKRTLSDDDGRGEKQPNASSSSLPQEIPISTNDFIGKKSKKFDQQQSSDVVVSPSTLNSSSSVEDVGLDLESLLATRTTKEKENKKSTNEIMELLNTQSVQEQRMAEKFRSDGTQLKEFCPHGTKENCRNTARAEGKPRHSCNRLHFRKIIQKHTDESLGDCSFLNTCFHMNTCKYIHYEIVRDEKSSSKSTNERFRRPSGGSSSTAERDLGPGLASNNSVIDPPTKLFPPQWIQCDLRFFDLSVLGKFSVVMADPPWDIHMELPYGTMSDDEMRHLNVQCLQDEGLMFLWVTGRAMELGRECLKLWGYQQCDEIIWVKTNQLQRIIRTGRTGHWLNHGKEHCLVGVKGSIEKYNRGLDCDVIVAEVRATSHKPDEVYGIIERLSPGTRKIELFGRQHNVQHNWITLGNQLDGVRLLDLDVVAQFRERYPDGNCMPKPEEVLQYKQKQQQNLGGGIMSPF